MSDTPDKPPSGASRNGNPLPSSQPRRRMAWAATAIAAAAVAALTAVLLRTPHNNRTITQDATRRAWCLVYYLSYDNDLSPFAPGIIGELEKGVREAGGAVTVVVLEDNAENERLRRHLIMAGGRRTATLAHDNSASAATLRGLFDWTVANVPARHYAVVFMNHGGGLNEMNLDEHPGNEREACWLDARQAGAELARFRRDAPGTVELVFLQQCGRASIENLYNFRDTAACVMASQMPVGRPNTYYVPVLRGLGGAPVTSGRRLARRIMDADRHFNNYVCVDAAALAELPARLDQATVPRPTGATLRPPGGVPACFVYGDETFCDLFSWLDAAVREGSLEPASVAGFEKWARLQLILEYAVHPDQTQALAGLCGLSLRVPAAPETRGRYRHHPFFHAGHLQELWDALYPAPPGP